jgi:hypothetical protein
MCLVGACRPAVRWATSSDPVATIKSVDGCVCPPCPTCRTIGKAECYRALEGKLDDHGLELSMDQRISRAEYGVAQAEERLADSKMELEWLKAKKLNPELEG